MGYYGRLRTTQDMVTELNILTKKINLSKPFVYVAHSMAGFNARLYQNQFTDDIAGMVLIDSSHPDYFERIRNIIPTESNVSEKMKEFRKLMNDGEYIEPEFFDWEISSSQVRKTNQIENIPVVVLSENEKKDWEEIPEEIIESFQNEWRKMQEEIVKLSSNCSQIVVQESSHYIYEDHPELVIDAVLKVFKEVSS